MKCPKCGNPNLAYTVKLAKKIKVRDVKKGEIRTDFGAECKNCGWKGEIGKPMALLTTPFNTVEVK
jgi:predicted nucleic-acid-binding Zn-ribbon protein